MRLARAEAIELSVHDYSDAMREAMKWLGDRHLLAVPLKSQRLRQAPRLYFLEGPRWHPRSAALPIGRAAG